MEPHPHHPATQSFAARCEAVRRFDTPETILTALATLLELPAHQLHTADHVVINIAAGHWPVATAEHHQTHTIWNLNTCSVIKAEL